MQELTEFFKTLLSCILCAYHNHISLSHFLNHKHFKQKLRVFLKGIVAMVTHAMMMTTTCSTMIGCSCDTFIVASLDMVWQS